jgi:AcrR family transcriptional regulator
MTRASPAPPAAVTVSYNQIGQKLGRKGQETRERILAAMLELAADPDGPPLTLTCVARAAGVRLTNLYLYFPDLGELALAALGRVMATAEDGFLALVRRRWPDDGLRDCCLAFLEAHYDFWRRNARLLHLRNALADTTDLRLLHHRHAASRPLIDLLVAQMDGSRGEGAGETVSDTAIILLTMLERMATVVTNPQFRTVVGPESEPDQDAYVRRLLRTEADMMALVIADRRSPAGARKTGAAEGLEAAPGQSSL